MKCKSISIEHNNTPKELAKKYGHKKQMQNRKPTLPPSRSVLISLPLTLIEALDDAANTLGLHRTDIIRR